MSDSDISDEASELNVKHDPDKCGDGKIRPDAKYYGTIIEDKGKRICFLTVLGGGKFGTVYEGEMKTKKKRCFKTKYEVYSCNFQDT